MPSTPQDTDHINVQRLVKSIYQRDPARNRADGPRSGREEVEFGLENTALLARVPVHERLLGEAHEQ